LRMAVARSIDWIDPRRPLSEFSSFGIAEFLSVV
jgi:hypothetical protein